MEYLLSGPSVKKWKLASEYLVTSWGSLTVLQRSVILWKLTSFFALLFLSLSPRHRLRNIFALKFNLPLLPSPCFSSMFLSTFSSLLKPFVFGLMYASVLVSCSQTRLPISLLIRVVDLTLNVWTACVVLAAICNCSVACGVNVWHRDITRG